MNRRVCVVITMVMLVTVMLGAGCAANPIGAAVGLAGRAVNDMDVKDKAKELMGASVAQADTALGAAVAVYQSEQPPRQWRVYAVKNDLLGKYRYLLEFSGGRVMAVSKADRRSDIAVDTATKAYFSSKCKGKTPQQCQDAIGAAPALSARNIESGQLVQLYDARTIRAVQRPYFAIARFGPDNICTEIDVAQAAASTEGGSLAQ